MSDKIKKILLTGATGFVGTALIHDLLNKNFELSVILRNKVNYLPGQIKQFAIGDFSSHSDFSKELAGIQCVIHLAGKAHVLDKTEASALNKFRLINTDLTLNLARQAAAAGVNRFIFLSSIGVNGNQNTKPFLESDDPNPQDPYAISKYEAECGLVNLTKECGLEVVIIRPPLVYGNNAPGNFGRLIQWADSKIMFPLPLGAVNNARTLIAIDNLVNFIITCILHPKAANEVFLISDDESLSTTQLLKKIAKAVNKKALLLPIPVSWMVFAAKLLGKEADAIRLFSSLVVDSSKARDLLDWHPITTMDEQLCKITKNEKSI